MNAAMTSEARLIAYVDGELSAAERVRFEAEMQADPSLAAAVERHRRLVERVAAAYAAVLEEPTPARLATLGVAANDPGRARFGPPQWAAMAACLVVGVMAGRTLWPQQAGPLAVRGDLLVAQGGLDRALTAQLASDTGAVRVGLSFRPRDGGYCRTFQSAGDRLAGLACRREGRWVVETATAWRPPAAPEYRTAASAMPPAVLAAVDAAIDGGPLDAAAERAARDRGWQP
ncbi:MAG: anti-sigma factor family protein [Phenylobacterium sp.]